MRSFRCSPEVGEEEDDGGGILLYPIIGFARSLHKAEKKILHCIDTLRFLAALRQ